MHWRPPVLNPKPLEQVFKGTYIRAYWSVALENSYMVYAVCCCRWTENTCNPTSPINQALIFAFSRDHYSHTHTHIYIMYYIHNTSILKYCILTMIPWKTKDTPIGVYMYINTLEPSQISKYNSSHLRFRVSAEDRQVARATCHRCKVSQVRLPIWMVWLAWPIDWET